jgi:hypothetical protein
MKNSIIKYILFPIVLLSFSCKQPENGYVSEKIIKYYVIVDDCKIELTEDQFNYTGLGQWIDFKKATGE